MTASPIAEGREHTPTPWEHEPGIDGCHIYSGDGSYQPIATTDGTDFPEDVQDANAAFIVRACNEYSALTAANAKLSDVVRNVADISDGTLNSCTLNDFAILFRSLRHQARAALRGDKS
jgi:hypothetical protein